MSGYEPLDISSYLNRGAWDLGLKHRMGRQFLRGIPFQFGAHPLKFCLVPTATPVPTRILVARTLRHIIVAHRMLGVGPASDREAVGRHIADYIFHLDGTSPITVPIRQLFDINVIPGRLPALAVSDQADELFPRDVGPYGEAGERQCESRPGVADDYYLWAWKNPHPQLELKQIEIVGRDVPFAIGAVTISLEEEHPLRAAPRRAVIIESTIDPAELRLDVDRGATTYVQPIQDPGSPPSEPPGWGSLASGRSYADVAALPSATVTLLHHNAGIGSTTWRELDQGDSVAMGSALIRVTHGHKNWVHVRVLDGDSGRPVPCRVHFESIEGVPFQPHGHHNHVNSNLDTWHVDVGGDVRLGDTTYAYIDGTCQGWLPRGQVVAEVTRGFEYQPVREVVTIEPGQRELTLRISRWIDMASHGWYSGDSHVHFLSTQGAHLEQQCEDLHVVNLLQAQWGSLFTNVEDFTGRVSRSNDGDYLTYVGQENRQHVLGHLILWGLKEPVMPWGSDGPDEGEIGGSLEATLASWADRAHSQGATVIIPHFPVPNGEPAVLAATGRADGVESIRWDHESEQAYYSYLNCGYQLPLVGGTDKMSSDVPVGLYRTYAQLAEEFSYNAWCRAVRAGRTFLSGGPLIQLKVDGRDIGDTVELARSGTVHIDAWAESIFPLHALEIIVNGRVAASTGTARSVSGRFVIEESVPINGHSWVAARCYAERGNHLDVLHRAVYAHTSPIYVAVGGEWARRDESSARHLLKLVERGLAYVRHNAPQYPRGSVTHHHGLDDHLDFLEAPFREATRAIERKYPELPVSDGGNARSF